MGDYLLHLMYNDHCNLLFCIIRGLPSVLVTVLIDTASQSSPIAYHTPPTYMYTVQLTM